MIKKVKYEESQLSEVELIELNRAIDLINKGYVMNVIKIEEPFAVCEIIEGNTKYKFKIPKKALQKIK